MRDIEFTIHIRRAGTLMDLFNLFKHVPVMKWLLDHQHTWADPMEYIPEALDVIRNRKHPGLNVPMQEDNVITYTSNSGETVGTLTVPRDHLWKSVDINTPGVLRLKLTLSALLNTNGAIVNIHGNHIFNKVTKQLVTPPDTIRWRADKYISDTIFINHLDPDDLPKGLANLVCGAISYDERYDYPAIMRLLVGNHIGEHVGVSKEAIDSSLDRAIHMGLIPSDYYKIWIPPIAK